MRNGKFILFGCILVNSSMQSAEIVSALKSIFTKHKDSQNRDVMHKNIQQDQYIPIPDELSTEEENTGNNAKNTLSHEERELKALQQFLNCHGIIKSI